MEKPTPDCSACAASTTNSRQLFSTCKIHLYIYIYLFRTLECIGLIQMYTYKCICKRCLSCTVSLVHSLVSICQYQNFSLSLTCTLTRSVDSSTDWSCHRRAQSRYYTTSNLSFSTGTVLQYRGSLALRLNGLSTTPKRRKCRLFHAFYCIQK